MGSEVGENKALKAALDFWNTLHNQVSSLAQSLGLRNEEALLLLIFWELRAVHDHLEAINRILAEENSNNKKPSE